MLKKIGKHRMLERGQSLVEYGLILILAAIVVIVALTLFGDRVKNTYCEIVLSIAPDIDAPACSGVDVTCTTYSSPFRMEASVKSLEGEKITKVVFYVDGKPYNTENHYRYCLEAGDAACEKYEGPSGKHTFTAVAYDAKGNTGKCSKTVTVP
jgi:Flp pilus assembly pilin Flp